MYYVIEAFINISNVDYPVENIDKKPFDIYQEAVTEFIQHADPAFEIHMEQKPNRDIMGYICDEHDVYRRIWVLCEYDTEDAADYFINQLFYEYAKVEVMEYRKQLYDEHNELEHPAMG